jgi:hypothetical protein
MTKNKSLKSKMAVWANFAPGSITKIELDKETSAEKTIWVKLNGQKMSKPFLPEEVEEIKSQKPFRVSGQFITQYIVGIMRKNRIPIVNVNEGDLNNLMVLFETMEFQSPANAETYFIKEIKKIQKANSLRIVKK